jgi:hypothetical protein
MGAIFNEPIILSTYIVNQLLRLQLLLHRLLQMMLRYRQLLLRLLHCRHDGCDDDDRYDRGSGSGFYARMLTAHQILLMW